MDDTSDTSHDDSAPETAADTASDTGADTSDTGSDTTPWPAWEGGGFGLTPLEWPLPEPSVLDGSEPAWGALTHWTWGPCAADPARDGTLRHATSDLTADGLPDLVVTQDDCGDAAVGTSTWALHPSDGDGFASLPTALALPTPTVDPDGADAPWSALTATAWGPCAGDPDRYGAVSWHLADLDGDGAADLVVTEDECTDAAIGRTDWRVHRRDAAGFGAPTSYALPAAPLTSERGVAEWGLPAAKVTGPCLSDPDTSGTLTYATVDLTGDGRLDLAVTQDTCAGTGGWAVYPGEDAGFSATPLDWALPAHPLGGAWSLPTTSTSGTCPSGASGRVTAAVLDLDGDGAPDLAVTQDDCDDPTAGVDHWRVHPGGPTGFAATARTFTLPVPALVPEAGDRPWSATAATVTGRCDSKNAPKGTQRHVVTDLDGDGVPELVLVRADCTDPGIGSEEWAVYPGTPAGFEAEWSPWPLPVAPLVDTGGEEIWSDWAGARTGPCVADDDVTGVLEYEPLDLTGDGVVDLAVVEDSCTAADVGVTRWRVYPGISPRSG